ncbi:hypothetical protein BY458DRAFT_500755 [Sporodiniella umbellata]|nr:hypothetical protein BY458DRAFT_500755 [Sporodiniella umbellata]
MKNHQDISLPISEAPCERLECQERLQCAKKRAFKLVAYPMLALLVLFFVHGTGTFKGMYTPSSISSRDSDHFLANNAISTCSEPPSIPYDGTSSFSFKPEDYQNLKIKYDVNRESGNHLNTYAGQTTVSEDKSLSDIKIEFDVKLSEKLTEDEFLITKRTEDSTYVIELIGDGHPTNVCISIDVAIKVPSVSALEGLNIELVNNKFVLNDALTFKKLSLVTANGDVDLKKGLTSGDTTIETVNGQIEGTINSLNGNLSTFTANGYVKLAVKDIARATDSRVIKVKTVNGFVDIQLPQSFESAFELKSIMGKKSVESDNPENIHIERKSFGQLSGYYGNGDQTKNSVRLQTVSGDISLKY